MAVNDFKAEGFLYMVLGVLSPGGNYFEMRVISATFKGKRISIDHGKILAITVMARPPSGRRLWQFYWEVGKESWLGV